MQGLAMLAPLVGIPLCLHALGGILLAGAGIAATLAPMTPAAVPILGALASTVDFGAITKKRSGSSGSAKTLNTVVAVPITAKNVIDEAAAGSNVQPENKFTPYDQAIMA